MDTVARLYCNAIRRLGEGVPRSALALLHVCDRLRKDATEPYAHQRGGEAVSSSDSEGAETTVRLSITVDRQLRKMIRIAAAYADLEISEWASEVLRDAAERAIGADRGLRRAGAGN
jgi:hypothetical protein